MIISLRVQKLKGEIVFQFLDICEIDSDQELILNLTWKEQMTTWQGVVDSTGNNVSARRNGVT